MRRLVGAICLGLVLVAAVARADIPPTPDRGPPRGSAAGLDFEVRSIEVKMPPGYSKPIQVAVLTGCTEGHPNCTRARARRLIGMQVVAVDRLPLEPEHGMVQQILDAFESKTGAATVALELLPASAKGKSVTVAFSSR